MNTCLRLGSGMLANASCRATPSPQSTTYAALLTTRTWADPELAFRGRGPPPVPRRMSLDLPLCANSRDGHGHAAPAAAPARAARNDRRLMRQDRRWSLSTSDTRSLILKHRTSAGVGTLLHRNVRASRR